jgi:hypothetical protein
MDFEIGAIFKAPKLASCIQKFLALTKRKLAAQACALQHPDECPNVHE